MVVEPGELQGCDIGVADDAAVRRDERHAATNSPRQPIGLGIGRSNRVEIATMLDQFRDQPRLIGQPTLDGGPLFNPQLPGDDQRQEHERSRCRGE